MREAKLMSRHRGGSGTGSGSGGGAASSGNACSGRVVTINLSDHPPNVPLGVLLAPACPTYTITPEESTLTILARWERLPESEGGGLGPIQRAGQVRLGDRLVKINNVDVRARSFRQVMDMLKSMVHGSTRDGEGDATGKRKNGRNKKENKNNFAKSAPRLQSLSFEVVSSAGPASFRQERRRVRQQYSQEPNGNSNGGGHHHGEAASSSAALFDKPLSSPSRGGWGNRNASSGNGSSGRLYMFSSTIQRARIHSPSENLEEEEDDDFNDAGGPCIEYEIVCRLSIRSQEERVRSVWRRYSAFKSLDGKLRQAYGWQIDALKDGWGLRFPGGHSVYAWFVGNHDPSFVASRRGELES